MCQPLSLRRMQNTNGFTYKRPEPVEVRPRSLWLLPQLHGLIRDQTKLLNERGRLLLAQELERVAREQRQAWDGRTQLVLRLLQGLHRVLGPALKFDHVEYWAVHDDDLSCFLYAHAICKLPPAVHNDDVPRLLYSHAKGSSNDSCNGSRDDFSNDSCEDDHDDDDDDDDDEEDEPKVLLEPPMTLAARYGALSILEYGLQHREEFQWGAEASLYAAYKGSVRVLDLVIRGGCAPCNAALSIAAGKGHVACVRLLHKRGVPLWDRLKYADDRNRAAETTPRDGGVDKRVLHVPGSSDHTTEFPQGVSLRRAGYLWGVLRYGQIYGAPVPGWGALVLKDRREKARAVLLSFHCAARYARGRGEHAQVWGLMANVPLKVLHIILEAAELELQEILKPKELQPCPKPLANPTPSR